MRFRQISTAAVLAAPVLVGLLFPNAVTVLVNRIMYMGWRLWLAIQAFDQRMIWAIFSILVFGVLVIRMVSAIRSIPSLAENKAEVMTRSTIESWLTAIKNSRRRRNEYARWILAGKLFSLYAQFYYQHHGINRSRFKQLLKSRDATIPEPIRAYLQSGHIPFSKVNIRIPFSGSRRPYPLDVDPEIVIAHLETLNNYES